MRSWRYWSGLSVNLLSDTQLPSASTVDHHTCAAIGQVIDRLCPNRPIVAFLVDMCMAPTIIDWR
jgi:hypothetical protein